MPQPYCKRIKSYSWSSDRTKACSASKRYKYPYKSHAIETDGRIPEEADVGPIISLNHTPSHWLNSLAQSLAFALTTSPCSSAFQVYIYFAVATFSPLFDIPSRKFPPCAVSFDIFFFHDTRLQRRKKLWGLGPAGSRRR